MKTDRMLIYPTEDEVQRIVLHYLDHSGRVTNTTDMSNSATKCDSIILLSCRECADSRFRVQEPP